MDKIKRAMITGISGQDGSYLAEFLLTKGYEVYGMLRRTATDNTRNIAHLIGEPNFFLRWGDLSTSDGLTEMVQDMDEVYNLAAQSHVGISFDIPEYTGEVTGLGTLRLLEAIRRSSRKDKIRFFQASTSEMFGNVPPPQNEETPMHPRSPYAIAKLYAYWVVRNYRDGYGIHASNAISHNHESERRGENFLTHKVTKAVANIVAGKQKSLGLGNLTAERDWGYAPEFVEVFWKMLQQDEPDDYVIGTEETHTVQDWVAEAFAYKGMDYQDYVKVDSEMLRPNDVNHLQADCTKAREKLGWNPVVTFKPLIHLMVNYDLFKVREKE